MHLLLAVVAALATSVDAYPAGAGTCTGGDNGPDFAGSPHNGFNKGDLASANLMLELDGDALDPAVQKMIPSGEEWMLSLKSSSSSEGFKGFLVRLSGDKDLSGSFLIEGDMLSGELAQVLESTGEANGIPATCATDVAAVTHKNSDSKNEVKMALKINEQLGAGQGELQVTAVKQKQEYYFTSFPIQFESAAAAAPTEAPAASNGTAPTSAPAVDPTAPTQPPSGAPSGAISALAMASVVGLGWFLA